MISRETPYRGRFAPTPSGPLHLGSLVTALASFLDARSQGGAWLLRIDDLDRERCPPGAVDEILRQLEAHGLHWDETPRVQTAHLATYAEALGRLAPHTYACDCSRAMLRAHPVYPGTCRDRTLPEGSRRLRVPAVTDCFDDAWQGRQCRDLAREVGDFVLRRRDRTFGYQLACAVDEHEQRITHVVRGSDLLDSTFQQRFVLRQLGLPAPRYGHLPVLVDERGLKLSKQNHAAPAEARDASRNLIRCLELLGQRPLLPDGATPAEVLAWATAHWVAANVPRTAQIALPSPL